MPLIPRQQTPQPLPHPRTEAHVPTDSEIVSILSRFSDDVRREFTAVVDKLRDDLNQNYVRKDVYDSRHEDLIKRVDKLEEGREWLTRLVIALIITGVLGAVLAYKGLGTS